MTKFSMVLLAGMIALPSMGGALAETNAAPAGISPATAAIKVTGTFKIKITATISADIPASVPLKCSAYVETQDSVFNNLVSTYAATSGAFDFPAVRSGATATCNITLPYTWKVSSTSDSLFISYGITTTAPTVKAEDGVQHQVTVQDLSYNLPKSGVTTTIATQPLAL